MCVCVCCECGCERDGAVRNKMGEATAYPSKNIASSCFNKLVASSLERVGTVSRFFSPRRYLTKRSISTVPKRSVENALNSSSMVSWESSLRIKNVAG